MRSSRRSLSQPLCVLALATVAILAASILPAPAAAQGSSDYTIALLGGLGGSVESSPDSGLDNGGFQGLFSLRTARHTSFQVRAGQIGLAVDADPTGLLDSDLSYLTLAGHYTFPGGFYESGVFIGLGAYDIQGDALIADETSWGFTGGVTGDFRLSTRWSFLVELSGHYADLDTYQFFAMGHVGLAFHF